MRNVVSILRRDLGAYFTSPIGYIFIMVFVTMSVGLYVTSFFVFPVADMRPYFENLPLLLCIFIPAVTMRVWAEERKENTWEMLLTFPMQAWELTVGKFMAAMVFYVLTLAATFTVPMMLFSLGSPDPGVIAGGYFGTLLLGACFLALGILFSGFFKDQIVAFVITLLTCFLFFLLGTDFIASYIDGRIAGLGSLLSDVFGVFAHYQPFIRGVVDAADVLFFAVWAAIFLTLNVLFIDGRNRPGARLMFVAAAAICVVIGMLFNYLMAGASIKRFDVTEDKIHTVSDSSRTILAEADSDIEVRLYITPRDKMPTAMRNMERDVTDKLEEMRLASGGKLNYATVYLEASNVIATGNEMQDPEEEGEDEAIERRMLDKGVQPFNVRAMSEDEVTSKLVYSSIGVGYKDKTEEIIPQIMPESLADLEYQLVNTIYKLTREKKPVVALVAPKEAVNIDPQMRQMLMQMGQPVPESDDPYVYLEQVLDMEKYEVRRVEMTKEDPLPEEYDTLVVVNPRSLNERQRWEINRALHSGKSVVLAVQNYEWDYQATREGNRVSRREENPGVNELLEKYGLGVSDEVLMDVNSVTLTVQSQGGGLFGAMMGQPFNLPTHILVNNTSMNQSTSITNRLAAILYLWGTALKLDEAKLGELSLQAETLMSTSGSAWTVAADAPMTQSSFQAPTSGGKAYPLMAMISGQFPDAFKDEPRPEWPKPQQQPGMPPPPEENAEEEAPAAAVEPKPGKLVLLGCSQMFRKNFLQAANLDLFLNSVDAITLSEHLVNVRGAKPIDRIINRPTEGQRTAWQLANYTLANIIIAGIGIGFFAMRKRARNAYTVHEIRNYDNN